MVSLVCVSMKPRDVINAVFVSKLCGVFDQERGCSRQTPEAVRATPQFLLHFCRPSTSQVLPVAFFPFAHMKSAIGRKRDVTVTLGSCLTSTSKRGWGRSHHVIDTLSAGLP